MSGRVSNAENTEQGRGGGKFLICYGQRTAPFESRSPFTVRDPPAEKAAENFLATLRLVSGTKSGYSSLDANGTDEALGEDDDPGPRDDSTRKRNKVKPGMNEDAFTMKEGTVVLQWPDRLSQESYEDLEAWAQLVLRKVKRHIVDADGEPA